MKVIDLLVKISKGEQPSHIRVYGRDWYWNNYDGYVTKSSLSTTPDAQNYLFNSYRLDFVLDKEVEIIEEKKIELPEKLEIEQDTPNSNYYIKNEFGTKCCLTKHSKMIADKLNETLDYLKYKEEEKEK